MKIKCYNCNKNFDNDKYHGICPKCGSFNRNATAAEQHQAYHNMYDNGYDHSEQANHQAHHDRYDNGYSHNEPHNQQSRVNDVDRYSPYRNSVPVENQKHKMPLVFKIFLVIFIINFVVTFLVSFLGVFLSFNY